jgi:hypothetical protein
MLYLSEYGRFHWVSSPGKCPSEFVAVTMWELCGLDNSIFGYSKIYYSNQLSLLFLYKFSFNKFALALKSSKIVMRYLWNLSNISCRTS